MAINNRTRNSTIAVSRLKETSYNAYTTLGVALEVDKDQAFPNTQFEVESNVGLVGGKDFGDRVTDVTIRSIPFTLQFPFLRPHELYFLGAYGLGDCDGAPTLLGQGVYRARAWSKSGVTRALYTGTNPGSEVPSFNTGFSLSADNPIAKMLVAGCKMNTFSLTANRDEKLPTASCEIVSSGKHKTNIQDDTLSALHTTTSLTLTRALEDDGTASGRLDSVHKVLADIDGDGAYEEAVEVTVASSATPAVLTVLPPRSFFNKVFFSDNGVNTDYTTEAKDSSNGTVPATMVAGEDYLYIGADWKFDALTVTMDTANAAGTAALVGEYWDGTAWTAVSNLTDGTFATRTLAQNGVLTFTKPTDWEKNYLGETGKIGHMYWLRLSPDATIATAGIDISYLTPTSKLDFDSVFYYDASGTSYTDETTDAANYGTGTIGNAAFFSAGDFIYVGSRFPFSNIEAKIGGTPNAAVQTLVGEYYNADGTWDTVALTDGTEAGGAGFAQDGNITFTLPTDWGKTTVSTDTTVPKYWLRLSGSGAFTAGTVIQSLKIGAKKINYLAVYRSRESLYLTEMATLPAAISNESSLKIARAKVSIGAKFDGYRIQDGTVRGCELRNVTLEYSNNHADPASCWQGQGDGAYGDEQLRGNPEGTITTEREMIDWLQQQGIRAGAPFSITLEFIGMPIDGTSPAVNFSGLVHCDRVWYETNDIAAVDGRYRENATLRIGESDDHPAVVIVIHNEDSVGFAV